MRSAEAVGNGILDCSRGLATRLVRAYGFPAGPATISSGTALTGTQAEGKASTSLKPATEQARAVESGESPGRSPATFLFLRAASGLAARAACAYGRSRCGSRAWNCHHRPRRGRSLCNAGGHGCESRAERARRSIEQLACLRSRAYGAPAAPSAPATITGRDERQGSGMPAEAGEVPVQSAPAALPSSPSNLAGLDIGEHR